MSAIIETIASRQHDELPAQRCACGTRLNSKAMAWAKDHGVERPTRCVGCLELVFEHKRPVLESLRAAVGNKPLQHRCDECGEPTSAGKSKCSECHPGGRGNGAWTCTVDELKTAMGGGRQTWADISGFLGVSSATLRNFINADPELRQIWDDHYDAASNNRLKGNGNGVGVAKPRAAPANGNVRTRAHRAPITADELREALKKGSSSTIVAAELKTTKNTLYSRIATNPELKEIWDARKPSPRGTSSPRYQRHVTSTNGNGNGNGNGKPKPTPRRVLQPGETSLDPKTGLTTYRPPGADKPKLAPVEEVGGQADLVRTVATPSESECTLTRKVPIGEDCFLIIGFNGDFFMLDAGDREFLSAMAGACDAYERSKV